MTQKVCWQLQYNSLRRQVSENIGESPDPNLGVWRWLSGGSHLSSQTQRLSSYTVCGGKGMDILKEEQGVPGWLSWMSV